MRIVGSSETKRIFKCIRIKSLWKQLIQHIRTVIILNITNIHKRFPSKKNADIFNITRKKVIACSLYNMESIEHVKKTIENMLEQ